MLPFFASLANQIQGQAPNDPSLQQAAMFNQAQFPMPPAVNFSIQNANLSGFNAAAAPLRMPPPSYLNCPNVLPMMQNNQLGILPQPHAQLGAAQTLNQQLLGLQLLGQCCGAPQNVHQFQGQLQSLNMLASLQPGVGPFLAANNLPHSSNFIGGGMANGQVGLPTMMMHRNSIGALNSPASSYLGFNNPELVGNCPMAAMGNLNASFSSSALYTEGKKNLFARDGRHGSLVNAKKLHQPISLSPMKNHHPMKHKQPGNLRPRVQCFEGGGSMRTFNRTGGRAPKNWREGKPQFANCSRPILTERRRRLPVNYTENEIQQWIQARRKNYPTRANIEKKLARSGVKSEDADGDAKLCRQQLKEVLAKQAELGVEVAEIPPGYISEPENQAGGEDNNSRVLNTADHFSSKHSYKRGRHGQEKWRAKRPKLNDSSTSALIVKRREPTLLRKLLSSDIKRDKSRLLQAFRFMVLNSFFEHWPEKPLEFPSVTVKHTQCEDGTAVEKTSSNVMDNVEFEVGKSSLVKEIEGPKESYDVDDAGRSSEDGSGNNSDTEVECLITEEHIEKTEEGEITE